MFMCTRPSILKPAARKRRFAQQKEENQAGAQGGIDGNYHCNRERYAVFYKIPLGRTSTPRRKPGGQFHELPRKIKEIIFEQCLAMTGEMRYNQ